MILKRVECSPHLEQLGAYLAAQEVWNRETFSQERVNAYVTAQRGDRTLLLMEWPDQSAVDDFMAGAHERLVRDHPLDHLLAWYRVSYFAQIEDVGMAPQYEAIAARSAIVRHTLCVVAPHHFDEFMSVQRRVWSPGMARAQGFLGGRIWRGRHEPSLVLVMTYFQDAQSHADYQGDALPDLRSRGARSVELCESIQAAEWNVEQVFTHQHP